MTGAIPVELITGIVTTAFLWLVRALIVVAKDKRAQQVFLAVTQAGVVGASHALAALRKSLREAQAPTSEGGERITPAELRGAIKAAADHGLQYLDAIGLLDTAIRIYGGREAVANAIVAKVETSLAEKGFDVSPPQKPALPQ